MAVLEYLTQNSLTAYPFKRLSLAENNNIQANWFYDIVFISYSSEVFSVYISEVKKISGELTITFNNFLNEEEIIKIIVPTEEVKNHFNNTVTSFYGASNSLAAVKLVLGEGLVFKENFTKIYTKQETELAAGAVILNCPKLKILKLKTYNSTFNTLTSEIDYSVLDVKQYDYTTNSPEINLRYNTAGEATGLNTFNIDVIPSAGAGLYDNCETLNNRSVYSVANVTPNDYGALYIKATSCYAYNILNNTNGVILEGQNPTPLNVYNYSIAQPNHALFFENFCTPKCPRENIISFAHYLNRVTDGAQELVSTIYNTKETRGYGYILNTDNTIFVATSFIDNSFTRCNTHDTSGVDTFIGINNKFIKNFHEFKKLQIIISGYVEEYTILQVISDTQIKLNAPIANLSTSIQFRIIDNGVFSNMNCASKMFNQKTAALKFPYIKSKYSSYESNDKNGVPITYITVNTAIFNPSSETYSLFLNLTYQNLLTDGNYKIVRGSSTYKTTHPQVVLNCKEYVFIETVFYTYSATDMGTVSAQLINTANNQPIGLDYEVVSNAQAAPEITYITSAVKVFRALQTNLNTFTNSVSIHQDITALAVSGDIPNWLVYNYSLLENSFNMSYDGINEGEQQNKRYKLKLTATAEGIYSNKSETITIDYLAVPKITNPLGIFYTTQNPKNISKNVIYTAQNTILTISAINMTSWVAQFPTDATLFNYSAVGVLPAGLSFDNLTGKLTGTAEALEVGYTFTLSFTATNPAGTSLAETVNFIIVT
jgi:hypothetical protein